MSQIIELRNVEPVARGGRRLVFRHPGDPALIIKVFRPEYLAKTGTGPLSAWRQKRRRYRHLFPFFQEVREHVAVCAAGGRPSRHMQNLVGFAETDYGMGLVYDAVLDTEGRYAPTLDDVIDRGLYTPEVQRAFEDFRAWLIDAPVVVNDLRGGNVVLAHDQGGAPFFVLIDGIGERTIIPIKGVALWLNRRSKKRHLALLDTRLVRMAEWRARRQK
jgi:hypothetical protein